MIEQHPHRAIAINGPHARDRKPPQLHRKDQDHHHAEEKRRDRNAHEHDKGDRLVGPSILTRGGHHARRHAQERTQHKGRARKDQRGPETVKHLVQHRAIERKAAAEIALHHMAEPNEITRHQALIQAQIAVQLFDVFRRGIRAKDRRRRIAGDHRHDQKHDYADAQKHRDRRDEPFENISGHVIAPSMWRDPARDRAAYPQFLVTSSKSRKNEGCNEKPSTRSEVTAFCFQLATNTQGASSCTIPCIS